MTRSVETEGYVCQRGVQALAVLVVTAVQLLLSATQRGSGLHERRQQARSHVFNLLPMPT